MQRLRLSSCPGGGDRDVSRDVRVHPESQRPGGERPGADLGYRRGGQRSKRDGDLRDHQGRKAGSFLATLSGGRALSTSGKIVFANCSGRDSFDIGKSSASKTIAGTTSSSLVIATIASSRSGHHVRGAVATTGKVTIYVNKAVATALGVNYLVIGSSTDRA